MLNRLADKLSLTNFAYLALALAACAALAIPGAASAASSGGAVVFSRMVTTTVTETVKDAEGNPVKDKDGKEVTEKKTTVEGGLFAVKDGHLNQLTEDPTDTEPSFSPDSRAIVFSRSGDVFSVRADGSGLRRVTSGPEFDTAPNVAPNGRYVLFERRSKEGAPADLYTVGLNGGATKALTAGGDDEHEASFSADGKVIVFVHSVAETGRRNGRRHLLGASLGRRPGAADQDRPRRRVGPALLRGRHRLQPRPERRRAERLCRHLHDAPQRQEGPGAGRRRRLGLRRRRQPRRPPAALPAGPGPLGQEDRPRRRRQAEPAPRRLARPTRSSPPTASGLPPSSRRTDGRS